MLPTIVRAEWCATVLIILKRNPLTPLLSNFTILWSLDNIFVSENEHTVIKMGGIMAQDPRSSPLTLARSGNVP
jgi:hypothetical protein